MEPGILWLGSGNTAEVANLADVAHTGNMQTFTAQMEKSGRILIPAPVRRKLRLNEGTQVIVKFGETGALQLESRLQAVARVQGKLRKYILEGQLVSEDLIADRRAEAAREISKRRASNKVTGSKQR